MTVTIRQLGLLPAEILETRKAFDCGQPALNSYLAQTALQHEVRNITRTFCAVKTDSISGYYSLTNAVVDVSALPPDVIKRYRLPTHALPVVRLARLAIARQHQRQGLGGILMIDAMRKVVSVSESSGCVGLVVDAKDAAAAQYYRGYGFHPAPENSRLLFMPLPAIKQLLAS
ncbi:MAG TPA: GNAT family N-acetyltransferase [Moraxellaceae bacterium]|nr:GNAT family N-acetyltransferase [Moraxellaceae bacterium]